MKITDPKRLIRETLEPHRDRAFFIVPDGTSQTKLTNKGRMGFWVERQFKISPNNSQLPDTAWGEIKTVPCDRFNSCSIGTISWENWNEIRRGLQNDWRSSFAYRKMKSTLYIFYSKHPRDHKKYGPLYTVKQFGLIDINNLHSEQLEEDWASIVRTIKRSKEYGGDQLSGELITLTYKGDSRYVYPSLSFKSQYMRDIYASMNTPL